VVFQIVTAAVASASLLVSGILAVVKVAEFRATSRDRGRQLLARSAGVATEAAIRAAGKKVFLVWGWVYNPSSEARIIERCVLEFGPSHQRRHREALGAQWGRRLRSDAQFPPSALFTPLTIAAGDEKEGCFLFPLEPGDMDAMYFTGDAGPISINMWDDRGRLLPPFEAGSLPPIENPPTLGP
jgi:hypothetical protein